MAVQLSHALICCLQAASTSHDDAGSLVICESLRLAVRGPLDLIERCLAAQQHMLCLRHLRNKAMLRRKIGKLEQWFAVGVLMFGAALSVTGTFQAISNILTH